MTYATFPFLVLFLALWLGPPLAGAQESLDFMPKGGKSLLLQILDPSSEDSELRRMSKVGQGAEAWQAELAPRTGGLDDRERRTLAAYLAVNMPLAEGAPKDVAGEDGIATALPPDGQELAVNYCQFCHSFFSGYLMIDRDVQGWRGTFETPFHREIEMTEKERETFARYSAINMPMKFEDVPEELRF